MTALRVIALHTLREAVAQPLYLLLLAAGAAIIALYGFLPFFTLEEDVVMFKAVGLDIIVAVTLVLGVIAAGRTVYEEIEDRTMLTLMSKPVGRGSVVTGKFLGLLASSGLVVLLLGLVLAYFTWRRIPVDFNLPAEPIRSSDITELGNLRAMHLAGLWPQLVLAWMQVGTLVAVGVALSTRFGVALTLPATLVLYVAGNLATYLDAATSDASGIVQALTYGLNTLLPFLAVFDLTDLTVYGVVAVDDTTFAQDPNAASVGGLWLYVLTASAYFVAYVAFILFLARFIFATRDLGGNET
jgi:ABC-type transport system involved in multi-copper enzyme maturation permease subunit